MNPPAKPVLGAEVKIFDPRDASMGSDGAELLDASVVQRSGQWYLYLAGQPGGFGATDIFSATLATGAALTPTGWKLTRGAGGELAPLAERQHSRPWDGAGGRHCPSYARGWDRDKGAWVERIYYAGAAENLWGPYTIGFLEWDGQQWIDQPEPAFVASQDWEHGSVYEPNLIYHDGKWRMWYVAGIEPGGLPCSQLCGERRWPDGLEQSRRLCAPEMKMFDFCVRPRGTGFDAIFARVWVGRSAPPAETGLWWCRAEHPSSTLSEWSSPIQLLTAEDRGWRSGPWKPSFQFDERAPNRAIVFFDGLYRTGDPGPFPFVFTLGCFDVELP
ncbi:MAG: hypothetical protein WDO73_02275 [Ignavibacteriota bacterium]